MCERGLKAVIKQSVGFHQAHFEALLYLFSNSVAMAIFDRPDLIGFLFLQKLRQLTEKVLVTILETKTGQSRVNQMTKILFFFCFSFIYNSTETSKT